MFLITIVSTVLAVAVLAHGSVLPEDSRPARTSQFQELLRMQCMQNNAEDKFEGIKDIGKNFVQCLEGLIEMPTVQIGIAEANPYSAIEQILKRYCTKSSQIKTCIYTLLDGMSTCLDTCAKAQVEPAKNSTGQLIDFACYKDGERITLFISEGGPQCLQDKFNDIKDCAIHITESFSNIQAAQGLSTAEQCSKVDELTTCIVNKLEGCKSTTPANMAASLFGFVRKGLPCETK